MSASDNKDGSITIDTQYQVLTHSNLTFYSVRISDWKRLGKSLERCKATGTSVLEGAAWTLFGVAGAAVFSLIGLGASDDIKTPMWIRATYVALAVAGATLACALLYLGKLRQVAVTQTIEAVCDEMKDIEALCNPGGAATPSAASATGAAT